MKNKGDIVRYSDEELAAIRARGDSRTDWAKVDIMTKEELEDSIAADKDDTHEVLDWTQAFMGLPPRKKHINIRVDTDVLDWFRSRGRGYQTYMNNVLRAFVTSKVQGDKHGIDHAKKD